MIKLTLSLHFITTNHDCLLLAQISLLERNLSQDELIIKRPENFKLSMTRALEGTVALHQLKYMINA